MSEAGPLDLISEDEDDAAGADIKLPGVHRGDVCVKEGEKERERGGEIKNGRERRGYM